MLNLTRPLVVFDLETTGADPSADRIVEIALVIISPNGDRTEKQRRINPGVPIPAAATKVHGITDADVADLPVFAQIATSLASLFVGCDVSGYNVRGFDLPMLECEFARAAVASPFDGARVLDSKDIFHAKEPRDLTAAYRKFCSRDLVGAHGALADTRAAADVLVAQIEHYGLPGDVAELAAMFAPKDRYVDPTRKLAIDDAGDATVNFGQHKGVKLSELAKTKPDYLRWMLGGEWHPKVKEAVKCALAARGAA